MTDRPLSERDHLLRVLQRHRFLATDVDARRGFCGGPYCSTGVISAEAHAEHVAAILRADVRSSPGPETGP